MIDGGKLLYSLPFFAGFATFKFFMPEQRWKSDEIIRANSLSTLVTVSAFTAIFFARNENLFHGIATTFFAIGGTIGLLSLIAKRPKRLAKWGNCLRESPYTRSILSITVLFAITLKPAIMTSHLLQRIVW